MYERYFGLTGHPFGMTPDPKFHFQSASHREALAALTYGVHHRRGFMILVGEVGTGKTTLINTLLENLDRSTFPIVITHTTIDREELLRVILHKLYSSQRLNGKSPVSRDEPDDVYRRISSVSRIELINEFNAFVNGEYMAYRPPPLLILDEAQNLTPEVLEEIRLLTNLEGPNSKLIQVLLAGQPELETTLMRADLRQLRQRVAVAAELKPLSCEDTEEYVAHRLACAGAGDRELITQDAVQAIWAASGGIPRTINVLCDYALINALGTGADRVTWALADDAIQDVLGLPMEMAKPSRPRPYLVLHPDQLDGHSALDADSGHTSRANSDGDIHE